jgi:hypothetical protein
VKDDDDEEEDDDGSDESFIVRDGEFSEDEVSDAGDIVAVRKAEAEVGERIGLGPTERAERSTSECFPELVGSPECPVVPEMGPCSLRLCVVSDKEFQSESPFEAKKKEGAFAAREAAHAAFWTQHDADLVALVHGSNIGIDKLREAFEKQQPDATDTRVPTRITPLPTNVNGRWTVAADTLQKFGVEDKQTEEGTIRTFFQQDKRDSEKELVEEAQARDGPPVEQADPAARGPAGATDSTGEEQSTAKKKRRRITPQLVDGTSAKGEQASSGKSADPSAGKSSEHSENSVSTSGDSPAKAPRRNPVSSSKLKTPADTRKNKSIMAFSGVVVPKQPEAPCAPASPAIKVHPFIGDKG